MAQNIDIHQQLIILCKNGDQRAQYQLYHLYAKQMLNISVRIVNNQMEAEGQSTPPIRVDQHVINKLIRLHLVWF